MNRAELERAMADTLAKIEELQKEINAVTDPREKRRLVRKKKELRYLQLWHMELYENLTEK